MKILANRMDLGFKMHQEEYEDAVLRVLRSGWYILGKELESFEQEFASFHENGELYCAGVASGLDTLWIGIKMLGIGTGRLRKGDRHAGRARNHRLLGGAARGDPQGIGAGRAVLVVQYVHRHSASAGALEEGGGGAGQSVRH